MSLDLNPEVDTTLLRYEYSSLRTPETLIDEDMDSGKQRVLKVEEVAGGYDPQAYTTELLLAPARDGRQIPITLLHASGMAPDATHPLAARRLWRLRFVL